MALSSASRAKTRSYAGGSNCRLFRPASGSVDRIKSQLRTAERAANAAAASKIARYPSPKLCMAKALSTARGTAPEIPPDKFPAAMSRISPILSDADALGSPVITVDEIRANRIAPSTANPTAMPLKRTVPEMPDAMPALSGGTTDIPTLTTSPLSMPAPRPVTSIPPSIAE
jgi:hypothetical protein